MLKTIAIGRLTRDPVLSNTSSGNAMLTIHILANNGYTDSNGQWQENMNNLRISTYGARALALNQSLKKGHKIYATMLTNKTSYQKNGQTVYTDNHTLDYLDVVAKTFDEMARSRQEYSTMNTLDTNTQLLNTAPMGTAY